MTHKSAEALGVEQVKGQPLVAEAVHLFDDGRSQDEVGTEPTGPFLRIGIVTQIL